MKKKTLIKQCKALKRDFEYCLIYVQPSHLDILSNYFKHVEHVVGHFYYFINRGQKENEILFDRFGEKYRNRCGTLLERKPT